MSTNRNHISHRLRCRTDGAEISVAEGRLLPGVIDLFCNAHEGHDMLQEVSELSAAELASMRVTSVTQ